MGHWNNRLWKVVYNKGEKHEETLYEIRETYYNDKGDICGVSTNAANLMAESPEAIKQSLEWMTNCLEKPVLEEDGFKFAPWGDDDEEVDALLTELDNAKTEDEEKVIIAKLEAITGDGSDLL